MHLPKIQLDRERSLIDLRRSPAQKHYLNRLLGFPTEGSPEGKTLSQSHSLRQRQ